MKTDSTLTAGNFKRVLFLMIMVLILILKSAYAQISQLNSWTPQYAATAYPNGAINASYAIPNGTNRLLVVAVASTQTAVGAISCSVTYGGVALTQAAGDGTVTTDWNHTFLFYLIDANIGNAVSGKSLNVTCSGGTSYYNYIGVAVFSGVDQNTPYTTAVNFNSGGTTSSAVGPLSGFNITNGDQAISIVNLARGSTGTTYRTISTFATNWGTASLTSSNIATNGPCFTAYVIPRSITTAATGEQAQHTASSTNTLSSYSAMSIKAVFPPSITSLSSSSGCVGSSLTINGTNLSGATSVTIGGTNAAITNNTSTAVTVTVGNGTTGAVSITTPSGTATSAATFTVIALPSVTFTSQPTANECVGVNLTYTTQPSMTNYQWGFPGVLNTDYNIISGGTGSDNSVTLRYLTTTGSKIITVNYSSNGCPATSPTSSIATTIYPSPTASVANYTNVSCNAGRDGSITISATGGTSPYSYSVDGGLTWVSDPANPYKYQGLIANHPYRVQVKDANGCISK